jgi:hypothetical protein
MSCFVILSEESLFDLDIEMNQREILRFAQNGDVFSFSAACLFHKRRREPS